MEMIIDGWTIHRGWMAPKWRQYAGNVVIIEASAVLIYIYHPVISIVRWSSLGRRVLLVRVLCVLGVIRGSNWRFFSLSSTPLIPTHSTSEFIAYWSSLLSYSIQLVVATESAWEFSSLLWTKTDPDMELQFKICLVGFGRKFSVQKNYYVNGG